VLGFNLIDEPCVRIVRAGRVTDVSVREAVTQAHLIGDLSFDDPLQAVAVLRQVLLPVVCHATGLPKNRQEWKKRWGEGCFDADVIAEYFARPDVADRFDLFGPRAFAQAPGLRTASGETKPVALLMPELATGNNVPLFSARSEADPPVLSPAQAFRALLAAHCWDTAAIKTGASDDLKAKGGKTTGNPTGPLGQLGVVIPVGTNLFETLMLNTPITPGGSKQKDVPQWCRPQPQTGQWVETPPAPGLLELLTWQARRIRLHPCLSEDGMVIVDRVVVAAGDRLGPPPDAVEPHTMWRSVDAKAAQSGPPVRPVRHQPGRAAWRGLPGLLAVAGPTDQRVTTSRLLEQISELATFRVLPTDFALRVATVGVVYGNQSAIVEDVVADMIPLPVAALVATQTVQADLLAIVRDADGLRSALNSLEADLVRASSAGEIDWAKGQHAGDTLMHAFGPVVRRILAILQAKPERSAEVYSAWVQQARRLVWRHADQLLESVAPEAFRGHERPSKKKKDTTIRYTLATAERQFKREVNKILRPFSASEERHAV
jgi:CRISPR system Cascade subunit CasA